MPRLFYCLAYLALMECAQIGSLSSTDLPKTGNKTLEHDRFFEIYVLDVFFTE